MVCLGAGGVLAEHSRVAAYFSPPAIMVYDATKPCFFAFMALKAMIERIASP